MIKSRLSLTVIAMLSILGLYTFASSEKISNKEDNTKVTYPSEREVVGDLSLPYSGPASMEITSDNFLMIDVGGDIGSFAIRLIKNRDECKTTGEATIDYDDTTGLFQVQITEQNGSITVEVFHAVYATVNPSEESDSNTDTELMAEDNRDSCPENKKCCKCKSNGGGSAEATCNNNEKPVCKCDPCCSSTCVPIRTSIDFE